MNTAYHGSCLCGTITYETEGSPEKVFACYCPDCSKNAGGPYQILAKYDKAQVQIKDPENMRKVFVIKKTMSGSEKHKVFCRQCGCTLWTIPQSHNGAKLILRTALLGKG
ncbi:Fc.00g056650.m01.CDS01 [Cosmosporella sp. VM-42]